MRSIEGWLPRRVLPVLMYHRIGDAQTEDPGGSVDLWISEDAFRHHMELLVSRGFRGLTLDEAFVCLRDGSVPRRSVLLTIDDGYAETLQRAAPILTSAGLRAAVFVVADQVGETVEVAHPVLSEKNGGRVAGGEELRAWIDAGFDVGSHSLSHVDLSSAEPDVLRREMRESKTRLEALLEREILDFCYPYTLHGAEARRESREAGYRMAFAGEPPMGDLWAVPRMMVYPRDHDRRFARKTSGWYYWLSAWQRRLVGRAKGS